MTIDEIGKSLPNGFHDAYILAISLDYVNESATFRFQIDLSSFVKGVEVDIPSRVGELKLTGLLYCVIEPPSGYSFTKEYIPSDDKLWIVSDSSDFSKLKNCPTFPDPLPDGSFRHWFWSSSHNNIVYVAAMNASFDWIDGE
jgi:hypothetical protein